MRIVFTPQGWEDCVAWADSRRVLRRVNRLMQEAAREPAHGIGKPERLVGDVSGFWSRRIHQEHRLVYTVIDEDLVVVQARYHY